MSKFISTYEVLCLDPLWLYIILWSGILDRCFYWFSPIATYGYVYCNNKVRRRRARSRWSSTSSAAIISRLLLLALLCSTINSVWLVNLLGKLHSSVACTHERSSYMFGQPFPASLWLGFPADSFYIPHSMCCRVVQPHGLGNMYFGLGSKRKSLSICINYLWPQVHMSRASLLSRHMTLSRSIGVISRFLSLCCFIYLNKFHWEIHAWNMVFFCAHQT